MLDALPVKQASEVGVVAEDTSGENQHEEHLRGDEVLVSHEHFRVVHNFRKLHRINGPTISSRDVSKFR